MFSIHFHVKSPYCKNYHLVPAKLKHVYPYFFLLLNLIKHWDAAIINCFSFASSLEHQDQTEYN